jgi:hypothetical protein
VETMTNQHPIAIAIDKIDEVINGLEFNDPHIVDRLIDRVDADMRDLLSIELQSLNRKLTVMAIALNVHIENNG